MTISIANVAPTSDTFQSWVDKTNQIATAMSTVVFTTAANTIGGQNSANAYLNGIFAANTMVAGESLRGGSVTASGNLSITSNVSFSGANVTVAPTYLNLLTTTAVVNAAVTTLSGTSLAITSNVNIKSNTISIVAAGRVGINVASADATLMVGGAANITANVWIGGITTLAGNTTFQGIPTISQANALTTGTLLFGNTGARSLSYDGTKYIFATANLQVDGVLVVANVVTSSNAGIDGVNVAAFKAAYDSRPILKIYDVNGTQLFTM
jgi:hypothetical protein